MASMSNPKAVAIVGGGPAGLYLSILLAQQTAGHRVRVLERKSAGRRLRVRRGLQRRDTRQLPSRRPRSYAIARVRLSPLGRDQGPPSRVAGVRVRRSWLLRIEPQALLEILTERAETSGSGGRIRFSPVPDLASLDRADLIVGADGANSTVRRGARRRGRAQPSMSGTTTYIWFGTDQSVRPSSTSSSSTLRTGMVWAHVYPYSEEGSTFIVETSPETWAALGFDVTVATFRCRPAPAIDSPLSAATEFFSAHLGGHRLLGNNSRWLRFPTVTCARWHHENVVLIGDAASHRALLGRVRHQAGDGGRHSLAGLLAAGAPLDGALVAIRG